LYAIVYSGYFKVFFHEPPMAVKQVHGAMEVETDLDEDGEEVEEEIEALAAPMVLVDLVANSAMEATADLAPSVADRRLLVVANSATMADLENLAKVANLVYFEADDGQILVGTAIVSNRDRMGKANKMGVANLNKAVDLAVAEDNKMGVKMDAANSAKAVDLEVAEDNRDKMDAANSAKAVDLAVPEDNKVGNKMDVDNLAKAVDLEELDKMDRILAKLATLKDRKISNLLNDHGIVPFLRCPYIS
jgi:hypothetical protein